MLKSSVIILRYKLETINRIKMNIQEETGHGKTSYFVEAEG